MRAPELEKMFRLEENYWWFVARRELALIIIKRFLGKRGALSMLDVGCGTGATLGRLTALGSAVGLDYAPEALALCRRRTRARLVRGDAEQLPFADGTFDLVTALDVMEHLDRDEAAVKEMARVLRPGGLAVLTVPACPLLWSEHDEALDHRRRYLGLPLGRLLRRAGFRVELLSYAILHLFPVILVFRLLQRWLRGDRRRPATALIALPSPLNRLLILLLRLESRLLIRLPLPFGVSLVAVARRPGRGEPGVIPPPTPSSAV